MKKYIVKKEQLNEYIERKRDNKIFYDIVESLHNNKKFLNEGISLTKINETIISNYRRKILTETTVFRIN